MAVPIPPNPSDPIPNDPFYYPEGNSLQGTTGPLVLGSSLNISENGTLDAVGGGPAVTYLTGSAGIVVSANTGNVRLYNTGVLSVSAGSGISVTGSQGNLIITNTAPAINAGGTVTRVETSDGITGGPITTSGTIALTNTGVAAATYANATITVDAKGRITAASPGTALQSVSGTLPVVVTGSTNAIISVNEGSPTIAGVVCVSSSVTSTAPTVAASSQAVKTAYDLAQAALPCSVLTTQGDLITANSVGAPLRIAAGAEGTYLKVCAACVGTGGLAWDTLALCAGTVTSITAGSGLTGGTITTAGTIALDISCVISPSVLTGQGALITATGAGNPVALGAGTNGQLLSANSSCSAGLEWVTPVASIPCSAFNVKGDVLVGTAAGFYTALPIGSEGQILTVCTACTSGLAWAPSPEDGVQSVSGTSPIQVDNTIPTAPVVSVDVASTTALGVVQLENSVTSTSTSLASTANSVKLAYDAALNSVQSVSATSPLFSSGGTTPDICLMDTTVVPGSYTYGSFTVDAQGRLTTAYSSTAPNTSVTAPITNTGTAIEPVIGLANTAVTPGSYTNASVTVDAQGRLTAASSGTAPVTSVTGTAPIAVTAGTTPAVSIAAASTTGAGAVQLNDSTSSTSVTEALTAAQGKNLQDQIDALSVTSNITLAGTLNTATGNLATVTAAGTAAGFTIGSPLPSAASGNAEFFVIVTVAAASYTPPGGSATVTHVGDWFLSDGSTWQFLDVGFDAPYASTAVAGIVELATNAETQDGTDATLAVTPAGLQSKLSDSTSTTSSTTIASSTAVKSAYDEATGATAAASAAQDTADQAVLDAAAAQADATQALGDAAAAQADADQALLDAAAAQATADAAIPCAALTAKGSILGASAAGTPSALAVGTDGQILYACSTATDGLCWAAAPGGSSPATPTVAGVLEGYSCGVDGNISVGFGSMPLVDPASGGCRNTSLGVCALSNLTFGSGNVAIGSQTLFCATNSGNSIAIGNCALRSSTFSGNVAIGNRAACTVTTGDNNVAIGSGAMQNATTPSLSIAIGCRAMQFGAGSGNMGFGLQALCKVSGNNNIGLGHASGSNLTTGSNNTFLGSLTGGFTTTGCCNIFIGFGAGPNSNADCCLWIGLDSATPWLTGNNTSALKPGAGIIDCAGSCGTAGQVLMSTGSNALCWGTVSSGSGTVTSVCAGTGLCGGDITTSGTISLDTACVIQPTALAAKGDLISASAASTPTALPVGTDGQVLTACSACSSGLVWATPSGGGNAFTSINGYTCVTSGTKICVVGWGGEDYINWMGQLIIGTNYGNTGAGYYETGSSAIILVNGYMGPGTTAIQALNTSSGTFAAEGILYPACSDLTITFTPSVTANRMNFFMQYLDMNGNGAPSIGPEAPYGPSYLTAFTPPAALPV